MGTSLREFERFATATWPMLAAMWPAPGGWIRGPYFQLREPIAPHVDVDLHVRQWRSPDCGARHDRDVNAAIYSGIMAVSSTLAAC